MKVGDLAEVNDANTAVDSYALSATGPGSGYVTLVEASGTAFTQPGDPVSMHIFKVGGGLDTGEVKVIPATNPLSERVTFQHTADLAGRFSDFEYEWKIAPPVDGMPPEEDAEMTRYQPLASGTDMPRRIIGGAGIQALSDNYVVCATGPRTQLIRSTTNGPTGPRRPWQKGGSSGCWPALTRSISASATCLTTGSART